MNDKNKNNSSNHNISHNIDNNSIQNLQLDALLSRNNVFFDEYNKNKTENNCINQLSFLFDLIITFMKNDSSIYWSLMRYYEEAISSKTKRELFDYIKKMNMLKEI